MYGKIWTQSIQVWESLKSGMRVSIQTSCSEIIYASDEDVHDAWGRHDFFMIFFSAARDNKRGSAKAEKTGTAAVENLWMASRGSGEFVLLSGPLWHQFVWLCC